MEKEKSEVHLAKISLIKKFLSLKNTIFNHLNEI